MLTAGGIVVESAVRMWANQTFVKNFCYYIMILSRRHFNIGYSTVTQIVLWESARSWNHLTLSVLGYWDVIDSWGGLKDPQPSTGLTPVRFLRKSHHLIRSFSWVTVQKMEWISSKMRKIWGFEFLDKSLKLRKFFKFIKEKSGGAILKVLPFCARCTDFAQYFF